MSTITTRAGKGSPLTNNEVDANFTNLNTDKAELSGATFTGEITANGGIALGDGDVATFGDSDDLSIQHAGGTTYLTNTTGSLVLRTDSFRVLNTANSEQILHGDANGAVTAYYDNSVKLATTATGIDVTGTATMDGLVVEQNVGSKLTLSSTDVAITTGEIIGEIDFYSSDASGIGAASRANISAVAADAAGAGDVYIKTSTGGSAAANRLKVTNNGDISFYEDTGTTPKFFWDASAESLGIGTSSPTASLDLASANFGLPPTSGTTPNAFMRVGYTDRTWTGSEMLFGIMNAHPNYAGFVQMKKPTDYSTNRAFLINPQGGNVGIGTSSPTSPLHIKSATNVNVRFDDSGSSSYTWYMNDAQNLYIPNVQLASTHTFYANGQRKVDIDSSGNLLVGNTSTSVTTDGVIIKPDGETFCSIPSLNTLHVYNTTLSAYRFYVSANGGIYNYSGNNVNLSDEREKKNIENLESQWDSLKQWSLKKFHYNADADSENKKYGVIAQEVETHNPEVIDEFNVDDETTRMAVKEQQMMWMAIKALQEAQTRIETLEARVTELENN